VRDVFKTKSPKLSFVNKVLKLKWQIDLTFMLKIREKLSIKVFFKLIYYPMDFMFLLAHQKWERAGSLYGTKCK